MATVDGSPTEIMRANFLLRAVELPAGSHTVRFDYRPASIRLGVLTSAFACVILGLFAAGPWLARRRSRAGAAV